MDSDRDLSEKFKVAEVVLEERIDLKSNWKLNKWIENNQKVVLVIQVSIQIMMDQLQTWKMSE